MEMIVILTQFQSYVYLRVVVVREVPSVRLFSVGYLSRAVPIVIMVTTNNIPPGTEGVRSEHILKLIMIYMQLVCTLVW